MDLFTWVCPAFDSAGYAVAAGSGLEPHCDRPLFEANSLDLPLALPPSPPYIPPSATYDHVDEYVVSASGFASASAYL